MDIPSKCAWEKGGHQSVPLATSPKPLSSKILSSKISFGLVRVPVQCPLVRIMEKILFCLVAENVYGTD